MTKRLLAAGALAALLLTGCATQVGPQSIPRARFDYGEAVVRSWNEQLLLNLVRLRYRDNPLFLEVGSIVTQYQVNVNGGLAAKAIDKAASEFSVSANAAYTEQPTITYAPLQGEDFVARLLSPISPANLVLLSQSGWSIERLLLCCVQKVNTLRNATGAAGPTPDYAPSYQDFQTMAHLLRKMQIAGLVEAEMSEDQKTILLHIETPAPGPLADAGAEIHRLLGLDPAATTLRVTPMLRPKDRDEIAVTGRSLLSVLFYFSQAVEAPEADEKAGRVTVTKNDKGERFDWAAATGHLLRIHSGPEPGPDAGVKVLYRGSWFWIADTDLDSKTTFSLLTYLFSLKAGSKEMREPLLTIGGVR